MALHPTQSAMMAIMLVAGAIRFFMVIMLVGLLNLFMVFPFSSQKAVYSSRFGSLSLTRNACMASVGTRREKLWTYAFQITRIVTPPSDRPGWHDDGDCQFKPFRPGSRHHPDRNTPPN